MEGYKIEPHQLAPKGINQLVYDVLNALWRQHGYVSNFTIHTMVWRR